MKAHQTLAVTVRAEAVELDGDLTIPDEAQGLVLFAHGSGSSRRSPRNRHVASVLQDAGLATLLFDLLTPREEQEEYYTRHLRFDIPLLAGRLTVAARWAGELPETRALDFGFFGASTGAAAALMAAVELKTKTRAVVSRGGRPDLAGGALLEVEAPTLLIVGGEDDVVLELNQKAYAQLPCRKALEVIPGATHLFEEPGALEQTAHLAADWFHHCLEGAYDKI